MTPYYSDDSVTIYHGDAHDVIPDKLLTRATRMRRALALELPAPVWVDVADIIDALLARLTAAEADADRLAEAMRNTVEEFYGEDGYTYNPDETACLRLHDEARSIREPQ